MLDLYRVLLYYLLTRKIVCFRWKNSFIQIAVWIVRTRKILYLVLRDDQVRFRQKWICSLINLNIYWQKKKRNDSVQWRIECDEMIDLLCWIYALESLMKVLSYQLLISIYIDKIFTCYVNLESKIEKKNISDLKYALCCISKYIREVPKLK